MAFTSLNPDQLRFTRFASWLLPSISPPGVTVFFVIVLLIGLALFRSYGVSWDEPVDQFNGIVNTNYISQQLQLPALSSRLEAYHNIPQLADYAERDHGPAFEYPVVMLSLLLGLQHDSQALYYFRHLLVFLVSFGGLLAFYSLAMHRFHNWRLALLATMWLFATPRLFAERFYNAKDAVFLALFTIGMYTLARWLHKPCWRRALWHGLACGAAIGLRVNGVLLLPLTAAGVILTSSAINSISVKKLLFSTLFWLPVMAGTAILLWPWLWDAPWDNITTAFDNLSHFQRWDGIVLYWGQMTRALELPWHYAFVWIGLTTPIAYLGAASLGMGLFAARTIQNFSHLWRTEAGRLDLLFGAWLAGPLVAVVVLHSVIYDGWRHLYFIYPALLLFAVSAVQQIAQWAKAPHSKTVRGLAVGLSLVLALGAVEPIWRIVRDHPHQQVYFNNFITSSEVEKGFERDYWGLSYRQGLEWILQTDSAKHISVATENNILIENNLSILTPAERARLVVVPKEKATYFLGFYRWHPASYEGYNWEVHAEYSNGVKILSIYKR